VAAVVMVVPTLMLLAVSDHPRDRQAGAVLLVLTVAAVTAAALLLGRRLRRAGRGLSLAASAVWLVGGLVVYPTQRFLADALWAGAAPIVAAVLTAAAAVWAFPPRSSGDRDGRTASP
jgi:hypothetical protein